MPLNFVGAGAVCLRQDGKLRPLRIAGATVTEEAESSTSQSYPADEPGPLQTSDTFGASSAWTITLTSESIDTIDLDLVFNQGQADIASIAYPTYKVITVPATSPYTVTETGLTVNQDVDATVLDSSAPGNFFLTQVTDAPNAALEFQVTANTLTFNSTEAGKTVGIYYKTTGALTDARGGTNPSSPVGDLEFFFKYKYTRTATRRLWFPKIGKTGGVSFETGGDNVSLEFTATLPAGWDSVYLEW